MESRKNPVFGERSYREVLCSPAPTKTESILRENPLSSSDAVCEILMDESLLPPPQMNQLWDAVCEEEVEAVAPVESLLPPPRRKPDWSLDESQLPDALCEEEVEDVDPLAGETIAQRRAKEVFNPKEYAEFLRQYYMSDGFDLDFVPKKCVGMPAIYKDMDELDERVHGEATYCAKLAISSHNEQHEEEEKSKLDFVELVKLNLQYARGTTYHITFKAKNGDGVLSVYQAKAYCERGEERKILIFREKPSTYPEIPEIKVEEKHGCDGGCAKNVYRRGKKVYRSNKKLHERIKGRPSCGCNC